MATVVHEQTGAYVYMEGDLMPVATPLSPEAVAAKLLDVHDHVLHGELVFIRLPMLDGREGLVNPRSVASIIPPLLDEGSEVE
jgi:hypothetical protein